MDKSELSRLKGLAKNATPGPWEYTAIEYKPGKKQPWCPAHVVACKNEVENTKPGDSTNLRLGAPGTICWTALETSFIQALVARGEYMDNAAFIAAANPQTVLALITQIERLEKENTALKADLHMAKDMGYLQGIRAGITAGRTQCQTPK